MPIRRSGGTLHSLAMPAYLNPYSNNRNRQRPEPMDDLMPEAMAVEKNPHTIYPPVGVPIKRITATVPAPLPPLGRGSASNRRIHPRMKR